jgi:hypothetical protein
LLGYSSNSRTYRVFNNDSGWVEITCDAVFDETNGFQVEQYDLDIVDDEEVPYEALQRMAIGDVRPQDPSNQSQETSLNDTTPLKNRRRRLEGGEWESIKIPRVNLPYIPKSTRRPSLLTPSRPHSYGTAIGPQNRVRNHSRNMNRSQQDHV